MPALLVNKFKQGLFSWEGVPMWLGGSQVIKFEQVRRNDRLTDTTENITFPQLHFQAVMRVKTHLR